MPYSRTPVITDVLPDSNMTTLDELDPPPWPAPKFQSGLVTRCHRLRGKPLDEFTTEDLRVMIGQQIASHILLPLAFKHLVDEPLASGDYYPGDLFVSCVKACRKESSLIGRHRDTLSSIAKAILSECPDDEVVIEAANSILAKGGG